MQIVSRGVDNVLGKEIIRLGDLDESNSVACCLPQKRVFPIQKLGQKLNDFLVVGEGVMQADG